MFKEQAWEFLQILQLSSEYVLLKKLANLIDFRFLHVLKDIKFSFQNLGDSREDKNKRRQTTFGCDDENKFSNIIG